MQSALECSVTNLPSVVYSFSSSTFKDPERASLRDSGHGDSDQADSDQDTNKGSCCDMSAKEALKMKATGIKPPPLEQGASSLLGVMMRVEMWGGNEAHFAFFFIIFFLHRLLWLRSLTQT